MKHLLLVLCLAVQAFAAGTVTTRVNVLGPGGGDPDLTARYVVLEMSWTGDSSDGTVPATTVNAQTLRPYLGFLPIAVQTKPGSPSPTNGYSLTVKDASGYDILAGGASSLSSSTSQSYATSAVTPPLMSTFTLTISGQSVASAKGTVYIFLQRPGLAPLALLKNQSGGGSINSVFGRTGTVSATAGDYTASQITNVPAGNIAATDVQAALAELDAEKQVSCATGSGDPTTGAIASCYIDTSASPRRYWIFVATNTPREVLTTSGSGAGGDDILCGAAPATPSTGYLSRYCTSGVPLWKDDAGTVYKAYTQAAIDDKASLTSTNTFTGRQNAGGAASTAPNKVGTSLPGTCTVGDTYLKTDATATQVLYACTSTNTWTQQGSSGGASTLSFSYPPVQDGAGWRASTLAAFSGDNNAVGFYPWDETDGSKYALVKGVVPAGWTSGTVTAYITFQGSGSGNAIQWKVSVSCDQGDTFSTADNFSSQTTSGSTRYRLSKTITLTGCSATNSIIYKIQRVDTNGVGYIFAFDVTYAIP
jgi:hypothetical protein